jgi:hypothetical protein
MVEIGIASYFGRLDVDYKKLVLEAAASIGGWRTGTPCTRPASTRSMSL